jgi:hypothetical protein
MIMKSKNCSFDILKHPLIIAVLSSLIFGLVVSYLTVKLEYRYTLKITNLTLRKAQYDKIFDKRAEIIVTTFSLLQKRENCIWDRFRTYNSISTAREKGYKELVLEFAEDIKKWDDVERELLVTNSILFEEIKIYFDMSSYSDFIFSFKEIDEIYRNLIDLMDSKFGIDRAVLEKELDKIYDLKDNLHVISNDIVYDMKGFEEIEQ